MHVMGVFGQEGFLRKVDVESAPDVLKQGINGYLVHLQCLTF